ncbi:hypothetical protein ACGF13_39380 [Kitasatospora sp. NPDC048286]|uniref:hypothetical protein n=1 Tax=Kitasatospora sp. NPDC048286 TaxID=3364047 RepID=UPI003723AFCC
MRRTRSTARTIGAVLASVLSLSVPYALTAPDAQADGGLAPATRGVSQQPGHPAVLYAGQERTVAAYCPQGTKPTGGGASVDSDLRSAVYFRKSAPDPAGNRWVLQAYNASPDVQTVHPRVICSTDSTLTYDVGMEAQLEPGETGYSSAGCDNTRFVVGGGFEGGDRTFVTGSFFLNIRAWGVHMKYTNYSPDAPPSSQRSFAVCSDTQPTWKPGTTIELAPGEVGNATAECPAGQVPLSGDVDSSIDVLLTTSAPTPTGWTVWAKNAGFDQRKLLAAVLCTAP